MPSDPNKGCDGSHSNLFSFNNDKDDECVGGENCLFKNITIIGNGDLSNDDKYLGGLINFKINAVNFVASNVLTSKSFITFLGENNHSSRVTTETKMTLDRCKCYDSYNSCIYVWGVEYNIITNSVMKRAGGAIALLDEVNASKKNGPDKDEYGYGTPKVDCYNVNLDNPVSGNEPWFNAHKASSFIQMMESFGNYADGKWLGRNAYSRDGKMNILTINSDDTENPYRINLIAIDIDGRNPFTNSLADGGSMLQGHFNIYNDAEFTTLIGGLDMAKLAAANPAASQAEFVGAVVQEALVNGNYLPTYSSR